MNKKFKIGFWISTGLLSAMLLMSAGMYVFNHENIVEIFSNLGYPSYIIYPLAVAKVLGVMVLWVSKNERLKEWAYVGFFFNFVLAFFAHVQISDGEQYGAMMAMVLLIGSYFFRTKLSASTDSKLATA